MDSTIALLPDSGPLITLAYADSLDILFKPNWSIQIVDMVLHEVTRHQTPTSQRIGQWINSNAIPILKTALYDYYILSQQSITPPKKSNLGEMAIQETMNHFALVTPPRTGVFLFEDHKIARASFLLPDNCKKVSTHAFLQFFEQKGWIESAMDIQRKAILNGRHFSQLMFPTDA